MRSISRCGAAGWTRVGTSGFYRILGTVLLGCVLWCGRNPCRSDGALGGMAAAESRRAAFCASLDRIIPDMTEAQVVALIGKPDDIVTRAEVGVMNDGADSIWCYGTGGHKTFPTLGRVYFCQGVTTTVTGQLIAPSPDLPDEPVLRAALDAIAVGDGGYYSRGADNASDLSNPRALIRAVNLLVPLGRARALSVLREYVRLTDGGDAPPFDEAGHVAQICEVLFGLSSDPAFPHGRRPIGLARIVVVDGVPLKVPVADVPEHTPGPPTAGLALRVLDFYAGHGAMRTAPLVPTGSAAAVWLAAKSRVPTGDAKFVRLQIGALFGNAQ